MHEVARPSVSQRVASAATLLLFGILAALGLVLALKSLPALIVAWVGMVIAIFGLWSELRSAGRARIGWSVVSGVGMMAALVALAWLGWSSPWGLLGVLVALIAAGYLGSYALRRHAPAASDMSAEHPVLFVNPHSGGGKAGSADLVAIATSRGIAVHVLEPGEDLTELAASAVADGADAIAMAGGDGSLAYVAAATIDAGIPFVCIPAGTRNHFARDLGLKRTDIVGALDAFEGEVRLIDYATVNGRIFLNVASLGLYAKTVSDPAYREAKIETAKETLRALEASGEPFDLRFTDRTGQFQESADLIMVSSGRYEIKGPPGDIGKRASLDSGQLGIVTLSAADPAAAVEVATLWAAGAIDRFPGWDQWEESNFDVGSGAPISIGIDGETVTMQSPLRFEIHPASLAIAVPKGTPYGPRVSPIGTVGSIGRLWSIAVSGR